MFEHPFFMRSTRPAPVPLKSPRSGPPVRLLSVLTLAVLLAHWAVLTGAPFSFSLQSGQEAAPALRFTTRTVATPAPDLPAAPTAPARKKQVAKPPQQPTAVAESPSEAVPTVQDAANTQPIADSVVQQDDTTVVAATHSGDASPPSDPAVSADASPAQESTPPNYRFPAPVRLKFEVRGKERGFPFFANGDLLWQHDGASYDARYEIRILLLGKVAQTSTGQLTAQGLEPRRFGDKRRSEVAAHFERSKGKITFSANTPDVPLQAGAQDNLSGWIQLASFLAGASGQVPAGTQLEFLSVGPRSAETWTLTVRNTEKLVLPGGEVSAIHVVRTSSNENDGRADVWLAPSMDYMPVRILVTWGEDHFADQQWAGTEKP